MLSFTGSTFDSLALDRLRLSPSPGLRVSEAAPAAQTDSNAAPGGSCGSGSASRWRNVDKEERWVDIRSSAGHRGRDGPTSVASPAACSGTCPIGSGHGSALGQTLARGRGTYEPGGKSCDFTVPCRSVSTPSLDPAAWSGRSRSEIDTWSKHSTCTFTDPTPSSETAPPPPLQLHRRSTIVKTRLHVAF
jgi:hypothetical protein